VHAVVMRSVKHPSDVQPRSLSFIISKNLLRSLSPALFESFTPFKFLKFPL
jgi:hypothetical protein